MLYYGCDDLSEATKQALAKLQKQIDQLPSHAERYDKAKTLFASKGTKAFDEIRRKLAAVSPPGDACFYCERDRYRDIDHVRPKRHYPEKCFVWENYVYACAICNQDAKRDTYSVFANDGTITIFDRSLPIDQPIPIGDHVLIDPRAEDPLDFLQLDLETGRFVAIGDARGKLRGEFTWKLFRLNDSSIAKMRAHAYQAFKLYLTKHLEAVTNVDEDKASLAISEILSLPYPTVLVEMRRQANLIHGLEPLFAVLPAHIGARPRPPAQQA